MQDVLTVIEERYPDARALGGLAGGGQDWREIGYFSTIRYIADGLVGLALGGNISVRTVISQGCRPIGDRFIVTKAEPQCHSGTRRSARLALFADRLRTTEHG